jgi:TonB family protein
MSELKERIELMWKYPSKMARRGVEGDTRVKFTIKKNGRLIDVQVIETSGYEDLDEAVIQALKDAEPYAPLPNDWEKDGLTITGNFVYSIPNRPRSLDIHAVSGDPALRRSDSNARTPSVHLKLKVFDSNEIR